MVEHGFRKAGVEGSNPSIGRCDSEFYLMGLSDTPRDAREIQYELYRRMKPERKIEMVFDAYRTGQLLSMAGILMQYPDASEEQIWHIWAKRHLGEELYNKVYGSKK
jgi:hypothetical protein